MSSASPRQHAVNVLKFARQVSSDFLSGIPEDKLTYQSCPTDNHPLWVMGHLASTDAWFAGIVGVKGARFPEEWQKLFGMGSTPSSDRSIYPPLAEVREVFDKNRQLLIEWLEGATDAQLAMPLSKETHGFALDPIDFLIKGAWHEGWHMGQVASVRKALGLPKIVG